MNQPKKQSEGSDGLQRIADFLPGLDFCGGLVTPKTNPPAAKRPRAFVTPITRRLMETAATAPIEQSILYQHTIFCQTGMPYRDPGPDVRTWERSNGMAALEITAGKAMHPRLGKFVELGLPFGPKPRLILAHLNTEALLTGSREIEVESTLTKFVSRTLKLDNGGRTINVIKDQLARLSASSIRIGMVKNGEAVTVQTQVVTQFSIWLEKDERQRVLWPSIIRLSGDYFESLQAHAVPLDEHHLAALSHSAMALDVYAWLSQRLHRVPKGAGAFVPWTGLGAQFGAGYEQLRDFRRVFKVALAQVLTVYREAKVQPTERGVVLRNSPPPVPPKPFSIRKTL